MYNLSNLLLEDVSFLCKKINIKENNSFWRHIMTTGVLIIHGFSGGPYEVQPFANYIKVTNGLDGSNANIAGSWRRTES